MHTERNTYTHIHVYENKRAKNEWKKKKKKTREKKKSGKKIGREIAGGRRIVRYPFFRVDVLCSQCFRVIESWFTVTLLVRA